MLSHPAFHTHELARILLSIFHTKQAFQPTNLPPEIWIAACAAAFTFRETEKTV
jgi:hypothetical protein